MKLTFAQNAIQSLPEQESSRNSEQKEKNVSDSVLKAAQDFEALLVTYLLKTMRKSIPNSNLFGKNFSGDMYKGLFDEKIAETISRKGGIGLADTIIDGLENKDSVSMSKSIGALSSELRGNYNDLMTEMALQINVLSGDSQEKP